MSSYDFAPSSSAGSRYDFTPSSAPAKKSRGVLGSIGHFVGQKSELAAHDLKAIPGGVIDLGEAVTKDEIAGIQGKRTHHTLDLAEAMGKGSAESLRHPLRDPFLTAVTLAPILRFAGGSAIRTGAAVKAAKAGEGTRAVVKAAAKKPDLGPRLIRHGDTEVPLQRSTNPAKQLLEAGYDKVLQHHLDTKPEGRVAAHAEKRIGGSLDETARYRERIREAPVVALDRAARKLGSRVTSERRVNQAALELTSVNTTAEDAAKYHLAQAEKGVSPERNRVVAKLYQTVHDRGLLTKNPDGDVVVDAEKHPKLAKADVKLAKAQGRGDEILARYGVRTPEGLQEAVNAPGRYRAGAQYEKSTPGKLGQSPALDRATRRRDRLQAEFDRLYEPGRGKYVTKPVPRNLAGAKQRLSELELEHEKAVAKIAAAKFGPANMAEVRFRTRENAKARRQQAGVTRGGKPSGASGFKATLRPTVKQEQRQLVEREVADAIERHPDHPVLKRWKQRAAEIDQLREALNPLPGETVDKAALGHDEKISFKGRGGKLERVGGALSVAKDEVQRLERALHGYTDEKGEFHPGRVRDTGIIGGETARPGRGHVSYVSSEKRAPASSAAGSPGPVVGEAKAPITSHANTGHNIEHGRVPEDITGQAGRKLHSILRFANTTDRRNAAIATGSKVRRSDREVLARVPGEEHAKISQAVEEALGRKHPTVDQVDGLNAALEMYRQSLVPGLADNFAADATHPVGTTAAEAAAARGLEAPDGYVWVSRHALGDLGKPNLHAPRGRIAKSADNVNTAITSATVYFKVGHLGTRYFTNAATNILQGSATPWQIGKSTTLWKALSDEDKARALAASGQHSFSALPLSEGTGPISRFISSTGRVGARWWAEHADLPFRFNSIAYEARKAGFDTPEKFRLLLDQLEDPASHNLSAAETAKVDWVAKRANREGIAYDRLSDFERRYITRALWFYPWTAGATRFAVNTLLEHPVKSFALGNLGSEGRQAQQRELGDLPSYEQGLFRLGHGGANPLVADFSTFSPFSTPADVLDVGSVGQVSGFLNPAYAAGLQIATRQNSYGEHTTNPLGDALSALFAPTPEAQIVNAIRHKPKPTQMFHKTWQNTLARALAGPGLPRHVNVSAANKAAARERSGR